MKFLPPSNVDAEFEPIKISFLIESQEELDNMFQISLRTIVIPEALVKPHQYHTQSVAERKAVAATARDFLTQLHLNLKRFR